MTEKTSRKIVIKEFEIPNAAYSARRYVSRAIRVDPCKWHIAANNYTDMVNRKAASGGIMVLPVSDVQNVKAGMLYELKEKYSLHCWTVGNYFDGEFRCGNGKQFNGNSCSIELLGADGQNINDAAAELFEKLGLEYCLLFCYNDKKLYYIDRE